MRETSEGRRKKSCEENYGNGWMTIQPFYGPSLRRCNMRNISRRGVNFIFSNNVDKKVDI